MILLDFQYFHEASDHRPGTVHYLHDRAKSSEKFAVIDTFVAESDFPLDELHESEDAAGGSSLQHSTIAEKPTLHPRAPEDRK